MQQSMHPRAIAYSPPGEPDDPWGPYVVEASERFGVAEGLVRSVMLRESAGRQWLNGRPIISSAGAMGLMQVMPQTYAEQGRRLGLGEDPYLPHDNILAGTSMLAAMTRQYGLRGGLAAYNMGPGAYEAWLLGLREMPPETEDYMDLVEAEMPALQHRAEVLKAKRRAALIRMACMRIWKGRRSLSAQVILPTPTIERRTTPSYLLHI